jgi:hypothetical protein
MNVLKTRPLLRQLSHASAVIGLVFCAHASAQLNCNVGIKFYPSGAIKSCELNGDHQFWLQEGQAVKCLNGKTLTNYPDGKLQSCVIAEPHVFGKVRCQKSDRIEFDRNGNVLSCKMS